MGLKLGAETIGGTNWQSLGLTPDLAFGKFGVGLDVTLHYQFTGTGSGNNFTVRPEDWVPTNPTFGRVLALYLPKIAYLRYGEQGDPLYVKFGSIDDNTLGNGFVVGGYSNTLFLPQTRLFGLNFSMDGQLFKFPYVGIQTFTSNVTPAYGLPNIGDIPAFDLLGAAVYARPLLPLGIPILKNAQVTGVVAADRSTNTPVTVYGADLTVPILSNPVISLASMASVAFENGYSGGMLGVAGRLIKFITYGAQLRLIGKNFIPDYFGPNYDLFRQQQYDVINGNTTSTGSVGWFATAGFSLLADKLVFNANLDGPFAKPPANPTTNTNMAAYPHLRAVFQVAPGVIPNFYFDASYDKRLISSFKDLISPDNSVITAAINYKTGPAVITMIYNLKYSTTVDPVTGKNWTINSGLSSSISLF